MVRCRDAAVRRMVDTTARQTFTGVPFGEIRARLDALDPACLHTTAIRWPTGTVRPGQGLPPSPPRSGSG
ncbi:MAG TPA: hypothetical protein VM677_14260 [Actinokineospora sp.]|nr:hypothetical protein [Actinokineospora sp.]